MNIFIFEHKNIFVMAIQLKKREVEGGAKFCKFLRPHLWKKCIFETPTYKKWHYLEPHTKKWHFRDPHL